jgi:epoxyqueuosine reductase QueG
MNSPLTTELMLNFLREKGTDLAGVAAIEPLLTDERYEQLVAAMCPQARAVVTFALEFPESALDACPSNTRPARYTLHAIYAEGGILCVQAARWIERQGFHAVPIPAYLPVEMSYNTFGLKGDINLKLAAVEAGLGTRGLNDLLLTPQFGPRVRLFGLVTDANLEPTPKAKEEYCTKCGACVDACPAGAILTESGCDPRKCAPLAMQNGLPDLLKFIGEIAAEPDPVQRLKRIRGIDIWRHWQALSQGSFYECFECIRACPVGRVAFHES